MNSLSQGVRNLGHKIFDVPGPVLIGRRHDFHERDDPMTRNVPNREGTSERTGGGSHRPLMLRLRRRIGKSEPAALGTGGRLARRLSGVERQNVRNKTASVLFGQRVISGGKPAVVECFAQMGKPGGVETVIGSSIDARPVMNGHDNIPIR